MWSLIACGRSSARRSRPIPAHASAELEQQVARYLRLLGDWGGLTRYGSADAELGPAKPGEQRVVFIGDDITEAWSASGRFFPGKPYLNRGIARQTTPQMLVRFRQDVIALKPAVVVIQGGTNDIAGITGPGTRGTLSDNLTSMTELAQANGIRVVLASILPICDCYKQPDVDPIAGPHRGFQRVDPDVRGGERRGVPRLLLGARRRSQLQARP